jgi:hypothetical protein
MMQAIANAPAKASANAILMSRVMSENSEQQFVGTENLFGTTRFAFIVLRIRLDAINFQTTNQTEARIVERHVATLDGAHDCIIRDFLIPKFASKHFSFPMFVHQRTAEPPGI